MYISGLNTEKLANCCALADSVIKYIDITTCSENVQWLNHKLIFLFFVGSYLPTQDILQMVTYDCYGQLCYLWGVVITTLARDFRNTVA